MSVLYSDYLNTVDSVVWECPSSARGFDITFRADITFWTLCNVSDSTVKVSVGLAAERTPALSHRVLHDYPLASGDTLNLLVPLDHPKMVSGDVITGRASRSNAVTMVLCGTVT